MAMRITKENAVKMQNILAKEQGLAPKLTVWNEAVDYLIELGLARYERLQPDVLLCHPCNRGGLGLSGHNAHETAGRVLAAGADLKELSRAAAFHMSPLHREKQIAFNERLVARSKGYLAPLTGKERFLTIGTGHTAAAVRAFNAGCATSSPKLQKYLLEGKLSLATVHDKTWLTMCKEGWDFLVIDWEAEQAWPRLPELGQAALNASNNIASTPCEPEVMASIFRFFENSDQDEEAWKAALEAAKDNASFISSYVDILGKFLKNFSGGAGAPMIYFLDDFTSAYGVKLRIGRDFMESLLQPWGKKDFNYSRIALMAINLCFGVDKDGVASCLAVSDVARLKTKALASDLEEAESFVEKLWMVCRHEVATGSLPDVKATPIIGKGMCRALLWVLKKQSKSPEKQEYPLLIKLRMNS